MELVERGTFMSLCNLYQTVTRVYQRTLSKLTSSPSGKRELGLVEDILNGEDAGLRRKDVCLVIRAIRTLGSEWRVLIVYYLLDGSLRFNELTSYSMI
jgi:hypothetical protein